MFAECVAPQRKEEEKGVLVMRTLILTLAVVLLAAPVWADVEIKLDKLGDGVVQISYAVTGETELVRAFALNVAATDGNIIDINDFTVGDDTGGYGIFPGAFAAAPIAVNPTTGLVDNWAVAGYSPVAPAGDPDALGDIPGPGITIEMGSLYETLGPGTEGILCTITVDEDVSEVCVTGNAIRGNVVLEDASEAALNPPEVCEPGPFYDGGCQFPISFAAHGDWETMGKPECWCGPGTGATTIDDVDLGYQCDGDAAIDTETYFKYRVYGNDLTMVIANWKRKIDDPLLDPCADIDHKSETYFKYRVYGNDVAKVIGNWKKKDGDLAGDCPRDE